MVRHREQPLEIERERAAKKLHPSEVRRNLVRASMALTAYELLLPLVVENVRMFFWSGFRGGEDVISPDYKLRVLSKDKHPFKASCLWLQEVSAITVAEAEELVQLREERGRIAHSLPSLVLDPRHEVREGYFERCRYYIRKLGVFWARIDIDTDPDGEHAEATDEQIVPGAEMLMEYILAVGRGPDA